MNKLLDLLAEIEASVEWAVDDRKDRENIMDWIHQAMDIAVKGKAHKWTDEKPEKDRTEYLVATETHGHISCCVAEWNESLTIDQCRGPYGFMHDVGSNGFYEYDDNGYMMLVDDVKYWWNLPEVTE